MSTPTPPFWPKNNPFLESLRGDLPPQTFMWMTLGSAEVVEMAAAAGVDCAVIDMEHAPSGLAEVQGLVVAAQGAGMSALVRVETADAELGRVLDLGVEGIVVPRVVSGAQARRAAEATRFPPQGTRGWSGAHSRAVRWSGTTVDGGTDPRLLSAEFLAAADASLARIFMIEDEAGVDQIDQILDEGRPDGVIFGWGDFTIAVGFDRERVAAAKSTVIDACQTRGIGVAISAVPADDTSYYRGCFYSAGVDSTLLSAALVARVTAAHQVIDRSPTHPVSD